MPEINEGISRARRDDALAAFLNKLTELLNLVTPVIKKAVDDEIGRPLR